MTIPLEITNTQIAHIIDEYIRSERDRNLLKRRYIDGIVFEKLSEEFELSTVQTKRIVKKQSIILLKAIERAYL